MGKKSKKKKGSLRRDTSEQQEQQPKTNDQSSQSDKIDSAAPSSSGFNNIVEDIKNENLVEVNEKKSTENSTRQPSDIQDSPQSDPLANENLELRKQLEDMQREFERLKAQLTNQQTPTANPIKTNESSLPHSNGHLQKEGTPTQMNQVKALTENQPPPKLSLKQSNINMGQLQTSDDSPEATTEEGPHNKHKHDLSSCTGIPNNDYNILLLGQTGVGKSTFINAFANHLTYTSLKGAIGAELISLIPCQFDISTDNFTQQVIKFGHDENENTIKAQSSTQRCKAYRFPINDFFVRMIDSPGIGDTRGIIQDRINLEEIFTFITNYKELHAICILLKPNEQKLTPTFQFCITQLLCQLHESASKNIVFVFTNSRNTFYRPGDTLTPLNAILNLIKNTPPCIEIPFYKKNTFCLDSEAFRFLVALKHEINFSKDERETFSKSWNKSVAECCRMIRYVVEGPDGQGLAPHNIQDTICINEARRAIANLLRPLAENAKLLQDNIQVLQLQIKEINECKGDVDKLKKALYIPTVTLEVKELKQPRTVCIGENCRRVYKVGKLDKYHYPMICHEECVLTNVPVDVVGPELLRHCTAMDKQTAICCECECHYSNHMHIYYESKVVEKQEVNQNIEIQLKTKEGAIEAVENTVKSLKVKVKEYEDANALLTMSSVKLAVFLQQNAMISRNDAIEEYIKQEIENEMSLSVPGANNAELIDRLNAFMLQYKHEKDIFNKALSGEIPKERMTAKDVMDLIQQLPQMNIWGNTVNQMVEAQDRTKTKEIGCREVSVGNLLKAGKGCV